MLMYMRVSRNQHFWIRGRGTDSAAGFTIVELIVTLVACAALLGGLQVALVSQTAISQRSRDVVIANAFAEGKIEGLRSKGFLSLSNGTTDITSELPSELKAPRSGSVVISSPSSALKQVDLTITYNDKGVSRSFSYTSLIGELGVGQY